MADNLISVAEFGTTLEANLACNRLTSAGIQAVLENEGIAGNLGLTALGSVRLLVHEADAQRSWELLQEHVSAEDVDEAARDSAPDLDDAYPDLGDEEE